MKMRLIVLIALMVFASSVLVHGQEYQFYPDGSSQVSESAFYTTSTPQDAGRLVQVGGAQVSGQSFTRLVTTGNSLWIVDPSGLYRRTSLRMPLYSWAREELVPGTSGYLTLYERYPQGTLRRYNMGRVYAGYRYSVWFRADTTGTHEVWYRVGGQESNHVSFSVYRRSTISPGPVYPGPIYNQYSRVGTSTGARGSP